MPDETNEIREIIVRLQHCPAALAQQQRLKFLACATVCTIASNDFVEMRDYAFSTQMQGRVRPEKTKNGYRWHFELDDDAVQFLCKFGKRA